MVRLVLLVAASLAIGLVLAGCGDSAGVAADRTDEGPIACTEIGCSSGVFLDVSPVKRQLDEARRVRICLRDRCRSYELARTDLVTLSVPGLSDGQRVSVRMIVTGASGKVLLRRSTRAPVRRTQPNGPECPPTCFQVLVRLAANGLRLVPGNG